MTIQLLGKDDYMLEVSAEDKYENYVASYMDWVKPTEGIDESQLQPTFLKRYVLKMYKLYKRALCW